MTAIRTVDDVLALLEETRQKATEAYQSAARYHLRDSTSEHGGKVIALTYLIAEITRRREAPERQEP